MNFWTYIGITRAAFETDYLDTRLVSVQHHDTFPLDIYTYGRACVHSDKWDNVTTKCRGIVVNRETGDIVARPFEKFFNFGQEVPGGNGSTVQCWAQPTVWEKVDGFLCTGYKWDGKWYVASKGSFSSPHAKWATHKIQELPNYWPEGYTPVFEGICRSLRIVVDYGDKEQLVLTALIHIESGVEVSPQYLRDWAAVNNVVVPQQNRMTLQEAHDATLRDSKNEEGFVLTWYRVDQIPYRLKLKYIEYLRLHRLVTGVSPKRILEALSQGYEADLYEMLNNSTPWFAKFAKKWKTVIEAEYDRIALDSAAIYTAVKRDIKLGPYDNLGAVRKKFALEFNKPENREFSGVLFALLDGKDVKPVIWKKIKQSGIMKDAGPLVDIHNL